MDEKGYYNIQQESEMDPTDQFAHNKLLNKGDQSIVSVYEQFVKLVDGEEVNKDDLLKEIDNIIFQNFKYRTAILSAKKDHDLNEEAFGKAELEIQKTKDEIKNLTLEIKKARVIQNRKKKFNELAKNIKEYETNTLLSEKIEKVESSIRDMEQAYNKEMLKYEEKERTLKLALSALSVFLKEDENDSSLI